MGMSSNHQVCSVFETKLGNLLLIFGWKALVLRSPVREHDDSIHIQSCGFEDILADGCRIQHVYNNRIWHGKSVGAICVVEDRKFETLLFNNKRMRSFFFF